MCILFLLKISMQSCIPTRINVFQIWIHLLIARHSTKMRNQTKLRPNPFRTISNHNKKSNLMHINHHGPQFDDARKSSRCSFHYICGIIVLPLTCAMLVMAASAISARHHNEHSGFGVNHPRNNARFAHCMDM